MEYVVIRTGGKQYRVSPGDIIEIDKLLFEKEQSITFDDVLLWVADGSSLSAGRQVKIGTPIVSDVKVKAKVLDQVKGEKIRVAKFKSKVRYRRVSGFRAQLTRVQIEKIESGKAEKNISAVSAKKTSRRSPLKRT